MKTLLSLPPNVVDCFHELGEGGAECFCTSDPIGARLGSGGGTTWLLESCWQAEAAGIPFEEWLGQEKRVLLHAGGQGRRLPAYAPSGKVLTPIPVFRWARGQRLSQDLLSLQLPLYRQILAKAPASLHTLVASGDVYIRCNEPLQKIPEADVVCYGLWVDPNLATNHGVFVSRRETPGVLDFMLQKPSLKELGQLSETHLFLMDIGIWLLSDRAVRLLAKHSKREDGKVWNFYDLYADFGLNLGRNPRKHDEELNGLSVAILPLPGGEFYHYGTSRELISSTLAVQNLVRDQRAIMQRKVKPHPAMFVQNAVLYGSLEASNSELWIENSCIGKHWTLHDHHILTGIPRNDWTLCVPAGICIDVTPWGECAYAARPYGFSDSLKGAKAEARWMGKPIVDWCTERGVELPGFEDIQAAPLFPVCTSVEELGLLLRWMVSEPALAEGKRLWVEAEKLSANQLLDGTNLRRLFAQRESFQKEDWKMLARNHNRSVFYQLDLADAAHEFVHFGLEAPDALPAEEPLMKRIHNQALRARIFQLTKDNYAQFI